MVRIQIFPSPRVVVYRSLKDPACPSIYSHLEEEHIDFYHKSISAKLTVNSLGQDLNTYH